MSDEEIERFEDELELRLWREYRDVLPMFDYLVETERRFYLANHVEMVEAPVVQRCRHHTNIDDVNAGLREAVHQCIAQLGSTRSIVAAHGDGAQPRPGAFACVLAEKRRISTTDGPRRFGRKIASNDAADVVLSKDSLCDGHATLWFVIR